MALTSIVRARERRGNLPARARAEGPVKAAAASVVALLAVACSGGDVGIPLPVAFEVVAAATYSGLDEPADEVVREEGRWADLWARIHRGLDPPPPRPAVDFSKRMLILVATGTRPSTGFAIRIRGIATRDDALEVETFEACPDPGRAVGGALTQPVEVVELDRRSESVVFLHRRSPSCP